MPSFKFGEVILVDFPYSDQNREKRRPGLVLSQDKYGDLLVARISSRIPEFVTDVRLEDWKLAGLNIPSTVRLLKMTTFHEALVLRSLGKVSERDWQSVIRTMRKFLDTIEVLT